VELLVFNERQSKHYVDTVQLFDAFKKSQRQMVRYMGSDLIKLLNLNELPLI